MKAIQSVLHNTAQNTNDFLALVARDEKFGRLNFSGLSWLDTGSPLRNLMKVLSCHTPIAIVRESSELP